MWVERRRWAGVRGLLLAAALVGCERVAPPSGPAVCPGVGEYFPAGALRPGADADAFVRAHYSKHLRAMEEPSFQCDSAWPAYRFLWLRSFHRPVAVRIERRENGTYLTAVELDGAGGYAPGAVSRRIERLVDAEQARSFLRALEQAGVWAEGGERRTLGLDGARWIVEARDGARYRVHDQWSPDSGPVRDMGLAFLALAGLDVPQDELY